MKAERELNQTQPELTVVDSASPPTDDAKEERRSHGKIAQLPKVLRDQINTMLDDGLPYEAIIARLKRSTDPPLPYPISKMNLSRWKDKGYQEYLLHQDQLAELRADREAAHEMAASDDTVTLP